MWDSLCIRQSVALAAFPPGEVRRADGFFRIGASANPSLSNGLVPPMDIWLVYGLYVDNLWIIYGSSMDNHDDIYGISMI